MKKLLYLILIVLAFSCTNTVPKSGLLHQKRVLILGNSITQNGRYVDYIEYFLRKNYPNQKLDIVSIGLSSETVNGASEAGHAFPRPCVHSRLDLALKLIQPSLVLASYGMNDGVFSAPDSARFEAYKQGIRGLQTKVKESGASLILLTPTIFDPNAIPERITMEDEEHSYKRPFYKYNEVLDGFANWLLTLKSEGQQIIDLHSFLTPILAEAKILKADSTFIPDGVHPNDAGHFLMAKKILNDLYPEIVIKEPYPTVNLLKKDSLFIIVSERRKITSDGWLSFVGYTKENVVKSENIDSTLTKIDLLDQVISKLQQK